jgi:hypothetical protein
LLRYRQRPDCGVCKASFRLEPLIGLEWGSSFLF